MAFPHTILTHIPNRYQCAFNTFERAGFTRAEAIATMRKSVSLAADARTRFLAEHPNGSTTPAVKLALSLGPFGATLSPAQEFYGFYPPPYGPQGLSTSGPNRNAWSDAELRAGQRDAAITALAAFHLERLRVFAEDKATWDAIDILAFETVPVTWEVTAIRRAMAELGGTLSALGRASKAWWVGLVCPDGGLPERNLDGSPVSAADAVRVALDTTDNAPTPTGLAVNCTRSEFLARVVGEMEDALPAGVRPWLVLYPNGGETYDPATQTWSGGCEQTRGAGWARGLADLTESISGRGQWDGLIVGGCCKTGPAEIAALAEEIGEGKK